MDHRGRFAKGCLTCRKRKIKCDETRPSCSRCLKGKWTCPGYRDLTDLTFRNQNALVARNAHRQQAHEIGASTLRRPTAQTCTPCTPLRNHVNQPPCPSKSLDLDVQSVACAYFLSRHVIVGSETLLRGQYEFLPALLSKQQQIDPALYHALNAAAFASFGNLHNLKHAVQKSRIECNLAIQAINTALGSPETAAKDSTMIAAMLLSTFEVVTYVYQQDGKACIDQLTGGLALLMIRGPKQLETRLGLQIFLQAYFLVVSTCLQKEYAIPTPLSTFRIYLQPYLDAGDCTWRILDLMSRFSDLLGAMKDQNHHATDCPLQLIRVATKLDDDFQGTISSMPTNWYYQILQSSDPVLVYGSTYHIYREAWTIRYWNYMRLCRIRLQRIILDNYSPPLIPSSLQYKLIVTNITQLSTDICATVPQHGGYLHLLHHQEKASQSPLYQNVSIQNEAEAYTAGIYSLLFPLFTICKMDFTPLPQRQWITNRLEYLGRISGISQAFAAAETMKLDDILWVSEKDIRKTLQI